MDSPFAPFSIPVWKTALQGVDTSLSRLVETAKTSKHYGHYTFPDPGLFISPTSDKTKAQYIESWLQIRDAWFLRLGKEASLAMSSQTWRTFLAVDLNVPVKGETKAANRCREVLDVIIPKTNAYPGVKIRDPSSKDNPFVWQGKEYPSGVLPPEDTVQQILWELYQLNFIHELLSLDCRACAELDLSDTTKLLERQVKISRCFPAGSFQYITIPSQNCGLAADNFNKRFEFVINLYLVMKSWKGDQPGVFMLLEESVRKLTRVAAISFEQCVVEYYCQQFFNYFGRAAQIPHSLFPTKHD